MIAIDTNILVYAHRSDSDFHEPAASKLKALAEGTAPWAIPWPCVHEFVAVVTRPRVYNPPSPLRAALAQVKLWIESPSLTLLSEGPGYWSVLEDVAQGARAVGPRIHDARIAAICRQHGVSELWSADGDFSQYAGIRVVNPLLDPKAGRPG